MDWLVFYVEILGKTELTVLVETVLIHVPDRVIDRSGFTYVVNNLLCLTILIVFRIERIHL